MKKIIIKILIILMCSINIFLAFPIKIYAAEGIDKAISGADSFLKKGTKQIDIDNDKLKKTRDIIYNVLLVIGVALTVLVGAVLGIKFMYASAEDKAKIKEALVPYIVGCIVIYGAFGIWKIFLTIGNKLN